LFIDSLGENTIAGAVQACGLEIVQVSSITEACEKQGIFDTVIVDQLEIVESLREVERLRYIPLVLIASHIPQIKLKHALDFVDTCSGLRKPKLTLFAGHCKLY
jgi:osomolarity two-component system sensor histidine kinase NIK1